MSLCSVLIQLNWHRTFTRFEVLNPGSKVLEFILVTRTSGRTVFTGHRFLPYILMRSDINDCSDTRV